MTVQPETADLIAQALDYAEMTDGLIDPTIAPLRISGISAVPRQALFHRIPPFKNSSPMWTIPPLSWREYHSSERS